MRILVCGGRDYSNWGRVFKELDRINEERGPIRVVIAGGATGVDRFAYWWASGKSGMKMEQYGADWKRYGNRAGPIRNARMLSEGKPDLVVAFAGGRGTADMVAKARAAGVEVVQIV